MSTPSEENSGQPEQEISTEVESQPKPIKDESNDSDSDSVILDNLRPRDQEEKSDSEDKDLNETSLTSNLDPFEIKEICELIENCNKTDDPLSPAKSGSSQSHYSDAEDFTEDQQPKEPIEDEKVIVKVGENAQETDKKPAETGPKIDEKLPIDRDEKHPAYVPKNPRYFLHDSRGKEDESATTNLTKSHNQRPGIDADKWDHDKFFQQRHKEARHQHFARARPSKPHRPPLTSRITPQNGPNHSDGRDMNYSASNRQPLSNNWNDSRGARVSSSNRGYSNKPLTYSASRNSRRGGLTQDGDAFNDNFNQSGNSGTRRFNSQRVNQEADRNRKFTSRGGVSNRGYQDSRRHQGGNFYSNAETRQFSDFRGPRGGLTHHTAPSRV